MAKHMAKPGEVRYDPFASSDAADIASQLPASSPDETMQFIIAADESRRLMAVREAARGPEMTAAGAKSDGEGDLRPHRGYRPYRQRAPLRGFQGRRTRRNHARCRCGPA